MPPTADRAAASLTSTSTTATPTDRALATQRFINDWAGRGQENSDTQTFWNQFLQDVMGIARVHHVIDYEKKVRITSSSTNRPTTKRIDAYIAESKVLIEQKSLGIDLNHAAAQSDDTELTPFQQAKRYANNLPPSEAPEYIITSNFASFHIYDLESDPQGEDPLIITLEDIPHQLQAFRFITQKVEERLRLQEQVNLEAARLIGSIYTEVRKQYNDPDAAQHDLAILMVRILFCLYAEDSGLFRQQLFYDYLLHVQPGQGLFRQALKTLFETLNTPEDQRDPYLGELLSQFPYVNGGLFADDIEIPLFNDDIKFKMIKEGSAGFNWSEISPVIFGSIFESILSGDDRRSGGMHYTSPGNIHKVIDPLFLDDLRQELYVTGTDPAKLRALQTKLANLTFLDPACGSGNFLTQTYLELRAIEDDILKRLHGDQMVLDLSTKDGEQDAASLVQVSVAQFFGIEINDFAVSVANAALWIADHQANLKTAKIIGRPVCSLPLKDYHHIVIGNALRMDWNEVVPASELDYIMGNPPFLGARNMSAEQKDEMLHVFGKIKGLGNLDYVTAWYKKSADYMSGISIRAALVSTNSISQGEQVTLLWKPLMEDDDIKIDFAWRSFNWASDAKGAAAVHCVIIGFSHSEVQTKRVIFCKDGIMTSAQNINPYLLDSSTIFVEARRTPISVDVPEMILGSAPYDFGHLTLDESEYADLISREPLAAKYIKRFVSANDYLNDKMRYCLWLDGASPSDLKNMPLVLERVQRVREDRLASRRSKTFQAAETPTLFESNRQPETDYLLLPRVSTERRSYIPIGYVDSNTIASDATFIVPSASLYIFGILMSKFHNAWMRVVAGRLKSDYRYSSNIVYNNFIWPDPSGKQRERIEEQAQAILDTRAKYPESSLADLYDPLTMPPDLLKAHKALDKSVEQAYRVNFKGDESKIVTHLFHLYSQKVRGGIDGQY